MMKTDPDERMAWRAHNEEQRRRWLMLSPLERLRWLDGAKRFAALAACSRREGKRARNRSDKD